MTRITAAGVLILPLLALACSSGISLDMTPMASEPKADRIQDLSMAISRSPRNPKFYVDRALAYENNGQYKMAIADLDTAIELRPEDVAYRFLRGTAYAYAGDNAMAKQEFARAEATDPGSWQSYNARAWLMATAPDPQMRNGKKAIEYASKACEMTNWQNPDVIGTLAAAYAEDGNFQDAMKYQQKSINLTSTTLLVTLTERQGRLALYLRHQPWRPAPPDHSIGAS